jgi:hypothetical protein
MNRAGRGINIPKVLVGPPEAVWQDDATAVRSEMTIMIRIASAVPASVAAYANWPGRHKLAVVFQ